MRILFPLVSLPSIHWSWPLVSLYNMFSYLIIFFSSLPVFSFQLEYELCHIFLFQYPARYLTFTDSKSLMEWTAEVSARRRCKWLFWRQAQWHPYRFLQHKSFVIATLPVPSSNPSNHSQKAHSLLDSQPETGCLGYWSNGGSFLSFCSILSSQGRNRTTEQVYLMRSLLSRTMTLHAERLEGETCS